MPRALTTAVAAGLLLAAGTVQPAHAVGPEIWTQAWEVDGPGAAQTEATVRVLDCKTILVEEKRADRATRYHRVEGDFPAPSDGATFPDTEHMVVALDTNGREGWTMTYGWTTATPGLDWYRVVWVPSCADDLNPRTR